MANPNQVLGNNQPADAVPEPLDDEPESVVPAADAADTARDREEIREASPPPETFKDEARDAIAARYRQLRDREETRFADTGESTDPTKPLDESPRAPVHQETAPPAMVNLVVDGKTVQVPYEEVVRRAQIATASDNRLEEAKRLLQEAKQVREQAGSHHQPDDFEDEPPKRQNPNPTHQEKLREIAERIQVGDVDDGAAALQELATLQAEQTNWQMAEQQRVAANQAALARFAQKYETVAARFRSARSLRASR